MKVTSLVTAFGHPSFGHGSEQRNRGIPVGPRHMVHRAIAMPATPPIHAANPILQAGLRRIYYSLLSSLNSAHVDCDASRRELNSITMRAACIVGNARARDQCFGRSAAGVNACATTDNNGIVFAVHQSDDPSMKGSALESYERWPFPARPVPRQTAFTLRITEELSAAGHRGCAVGHSRHPTAIREARGHRN
jgi:hypothetical protein